MVHRWQTRFRGTEDQAHVHHSVEATSLDLLTMADYISNLYRGVRWSSDDEAGRVRVTPGDNDDDGDDGGDKASPSRVASGEVGLSGADRGKEGLSGATEGGRGSQT